MRYGVFAIAILAVGGVCGRAETLDYKFVGVNDELCSAYGGTYCDPATLEFRISSQPKPDEYDGTSFWFNGEALDDGTIDLVTDEVTGFGGGPGDAVLVFNSDGFLFGDTQFYGAPLFTGSTSAPTLLTRSFDTSTYVPMQSLVYDGPLTITAVATPEPSSVMLLGSGVLGLVGAARRRGAC